MREMTEQEKLETLADILEMDEEEINRDVVLAECDTWDSVAVLSVISVINEQFNRFPSAAEIRQYKTIGDLMDAMK